MRMMDTLKRTISGVRESGGADILETLKHEHDEVAEMLGRLVNTSAAGERKALLRRISGALVPHLRAEERVVYKAVVALKDKEPQQDGKEGLLEHRLADRTLASLGKIADAASPDFSAGAKVLKELVEHHVEEEESNIWKDVREHFSADDRIAMNRRFEAAKKRVRARLAA
jgi:hemerythrin superfamily protein